MVRLGFREPAQQIVVSFVERWPLRRHGWLAWRWRQQPARRLPRGTRLVLGALELLKLPLLLFDHYVWTQSSGRALFAWTLAWLISADGPPGESQPRAESLEVSIAGAR